MEVVRKLSGGLSNLEYLADTGLATPHLCTAHCVWVTDAEQALLAERDVKVLHCPSSNLKLGSGLAPVAEMRARGISVSLGADGAACNNRLDMFEEMRLAATIQAVRRQPGALTARDALWMATREGARALAMEREIGSIETGKRADLILVGRDGPASGPGSRSLVHPRLRHARHGRAPDDGRRAGARPRLCPVESGRCGDYGRGARRPPPRSRPGPVYN